MYMYYTVKSTVHCTIRTIAPSVRKQQRKRTSEESEMVTYMQVIEVVRNRLVNHQAKSGFKGYTSVGALTILIIKEKNQIIANQTNKLKK